MFWKLFSISLPRNSQHFQERCNLCAPFQPGCSLHDAGLVAASAKRLQLARAAECCFQEYHWTSADVMNVQTNRGSQFWLISVKLTSSHSVSSCYILVLVLFSSSAADSSLFDNCWHFRQSGSSEGFREPESAGTPGPHFFGAGWSRCSTLHSH